MLLERELRADQLLLRPCAQQVDGRRREEAAVVEEQVGLQQEAQADHLVRPAMRQPRADQHVQGLCGGEYDVVAWGALEHCHVASTGVAHRWEDGDGGGAGADDDGFLVGVVEVFGPELRVNDFAGEVRDAGDVGFEALR